MKKTGFTLAETLITLGIIGVIASLTLPNLVFNYQKKIYVASLQRVYNSLSDAAVTMLADKRVDSLAETDMADVTGAGTFLKKYFKVVNDCGVSESDASDCMASSYQNFGKSDTYTPKLEAKYCVTVDTGASICMNGVSGDSGDRHGYSYVIVDTNGKQGPNVLGRDLFGFELYSDGKVSEGYDMLTHIHYCGDDSIADGGYAAGCFSKIMHDGWKMDY